MSTMLKAEISKGRGQISLLEKEKFRTSKFCSSFSRRRAVFDELWSEIMGARSIHEQNQELMDRGPEAVYKGYTEVKPTNSSKATTGEKAQCNKSISETDHLDCSGKSDAEFMDTGRKTLCTEDMDWQAPSSSGVFPPRRAVFDELWSEIVGTHSLCHENQGLTDTHSEFLHKEVTAAEAESAPRRPTVDTTHSNESVSDIGLPGCLHEFDQELMDVDSENLHDAGAEVEAENARMSTTDNDTRLSDAPVLTDLGEINRGHILSHLLAKVLEFHGARYGDFLATVGEENIKHMLEESLTTSVKGLCRAGSFDLASLISIGGNPETVDEAGIYMNIISDPNSNGSFWLYVGQSKSMKQRISDHRNIRFRIRHKCLHYAIGNSKADLRSTFVTLGRFGAYQHDDSCKYLLNLHEMWMACLFQTLTSRDLEKYLPGVVKIWSAGHHLNIVPPIWQSFSDGDDFEGLTREKFQAMLMSENKETREFARDARDAFNDLRNSPDLKLRQYHRTTLMANLMLAREANDLIRIQNVREHLNWTSKRVYAYNKGDGFIISWAFIPISTLQKLLFQNGDLIEARLVLCDEKSPNRYARRAEEHDPASRLEIWIRGKDRRGEDFCRCLQSKYGKAIVFRLNSLIDCLEGYTHEASKELIRRHYVIRIGKKLVHRYTSGL